MIRNTYETENGVTMYCPTPSHPYHRHVWRDRNGKREQRNGRRDHDTAWAQAVEIDRQLAIHLNDPTTKTIEQLVPIWLSEGAKWWARSHMEKYSRMARKYIVPQLGEHLAWAITRADVQKCIASPASESAKRHTKNTMGSFLTWAYEQSTPYVQSPKEVYLPTSSRRKTAKDATGRQQGASNLRIADALIPDADVLRALANEMRQSAGRATTTDSGIVLLAPGLGTLAWTMTAVAASCGLRFGEIAALTAGQCHFDEGYIHVDRQVQRIRGGGIEISPPKWGRTRFVPLPERSIWGEPLKPILRELVDGLSSEDIIFTAPKGGYLHPSNFYRNWFNPARSHVLEWDKRWTWHALRHSFCSLLLRGDKALGREAADITDVSQVAGHRDVSTTQRMYISPTRGVIGRLNNLFS